jgi:hypothetical protein
MVQPAAKEDNVVCGRDLHAFRLTRSGEVVYRSTVSRASSAALIFRPRQRPLNAQLTPVPNTA